MHAANLAAFLVGIDNDFGQCRSIKKTNINPLSGKRVDSVRRIAD